MIKVLIVILFTIIPQLSLANDFLRNGKQLLVCENEEILFRINWEDWDIENKSFGQRSKNKLVQFKLSVDREHSAENAYLIEAEITKYNQGEVESSGSYGFSIGSDLDGQIASSTPEEESFRLHYIDKEKPDAEIKKVCKN